MLPLTILASPVTAAFSLVKCRPIIGVPVPLLPPQL